MAVAWFHALTADASAVALVSAGLVLLPVLLALASARKKRSPALENGSIQQIKHAHRLPTNIPIFGHLYELLSNANERHDWSTALCEHFNGEPFYVEIPGKPLDTFVYTPQGVEDVLKTHFDHIPKGARQREIFRDLLGHGIFAEDGAKWLHQRKTASNIFTARALRDTMTHNVSQYTVVLERMLTKARDSGELVDFFKLMNKFTIEAFAKIGFGIELDCLEAEDDHPFQSAFDSAQRMLIFRFLLPDWSWKLLRWLNVGTEKQLKKNLAVIDRTVMEIISRSIAQRHENGTPSSTGRGGSNLVSLFLDHVDESESGEFDPSLLRDMVLNFLLAGRDTTAQAMSWCIYNLSQNRQVVAKIRAEIALAVPSFANGSRTDPLTMEEVQQLPYLEATLKETLRLHPSVPAIPKAVEQDTVLSDGTFLPVGSSITIPTYAMGRMDFIWGPDAKQFKPERWIDTATGKIIAASAFKFIAFNAGPRQCLGMNLAMLEMKIVLATLVARFDLELAPNQTITYDNSLTLPVKGELLVRVK